MKLDGKTGSRSRRAVGKGSEDLQPKLFDLQAVPAERHPNPPILHSQQDEAKPVDFKGANEYGLPAQLTLFEARGPGHEEGSAEAVDREDDAPREVDGHHLVVGRQESAPEQAEDAPEAFLKLVARIALRAGQKAETKQEVDNDPRGILHQGEYRGTAD